MNGVRSIEFFSDIPVAMEKFLAAGFVGAAALGWKFFNAFLAIFFAIFGITSGAISGAFIGLKTRRGILHGAIVRGHFRQRVLDVLFQGLRCLLGLRRFIFSPDPLVDSTTILATKLVHSYSTRMPELPAKGRQNKDLVDEIDRIPIINLTDEHRVESYSICLQELEVARRLPGCQHTFLLDCVDRWFSYQRFCSLSRHKADK